MNLQPGQILADKYRIVRQIGQGGMGAVFLGENIRIHRKVAIKTLHAQVAGKSDILQRFEREAQAAGRIGSDHICEVLDLGDLPDGSRFMVMEFLDGTTLGDRIVKSGRITPRDLVPTLTQLLEGLGAAHQAGIIHRDLKPANVFLLANRGGRPDFVKILDFGVSKFNVLSSDEMSMTRTGAVMGTPYYMSPEQAKGARQIDMRSDLYSVGVIIYEAITGQVPFNAETFNELIFKIALESPPPPEQFVPNLDPAFGALMRKSMAREPNERFQSAAELKDAVLAWAQDFDARGGAPGPMPAPHGRAQVLPMVGAMNHRGSMPSVPGVPPGTVMAGPRTGYGAPPQGYPSAPNGYPAPPVPQAGFAPGQTQLAHAGPPNPMGVDTVTRKKSSTVPIIIGVAAAAVLGIGGAAVLVTRSGNAQTSTAEASTAEASTAKTAAVETTATATATAEKTAEPVKTSESTAQTASADTGTAVAVASSAPTSTTPTQPTTTIRPTSTTTIGRPTATATLKPTATATQTATAVKTGRNIGSDL